MRRIIILLIIFIICNKSFSQNVGIGTTLPQARLHVSDSNVLFTGPTIVPVTTAYNPPIQGAGTRMMWFPQAAAFRAGVVDGTQWDKPYLGRFSFATGSNTTAFGYGSVATGEATYAFGDYSNALGRETQALGYNSTAIGYQVYAMGSNSAAIGYYLKNKSPYSLAVGVYNDTTKFNRLFEVGNGQSETTRRNALTVISNGNIGIGTINPLYRLDLHYPNFASMSITDDTSTAQVVLAAPSRGSTGGVGTVNNFDFPIFANGADRMIITKTGNVGINTPAPAAMLHVTNGSMLFTEAGIPVTPGPTPASGIGIRMMWYADKAAFRAGGTPDNSWDKDSIGVCSMAGGYGTKAKGDFSFATGYSSAAMGTFSVAMGAAATATFDHGIAIGRFATSTNFSAVSLGEKNTASGGFALATGLLTRAAGENASAFGLVTISRSYAGVVMGSYNDTLDNPNGGSPQPTDRLFQLGNGTADNQRSNALTIFRNGWIGVGHNNPVTKLDVYGNNNWDLTATEGDVRIGNPLYRLKFGVALAGGGAGSCTIRAAGGIERLNLGAGNTNLLTLNGSSFRVGIGTETPAEKLEVVGNVRANSFILSSDARLKKNITPIANSLSLLTKLNGYNYYWKDESIDSNLQSGLIAQEVQKIFPHLVKANEQGTLAVNYIGLVPVMVESIKTQQEQIEKQQKEIDELKKIVNALLEKASK